MIIHELYRKSAWKNFRNFGDFGLVEVEMYFDGPDEPRIFEVQVLHQQLRLGQFAVHVT